MDKKEAIEVLKPVLESLEKRGRVNILIPEVFTALKMAIEALSEPIPLSSFWIPIKYKQATKEQINHMCEVCGVSEDMLEESDKRVFDCPMPNDGQEILVCMKSGVVHVDVNYLDLGDCYGLEDADDWDDVSAWMPMPMPYEKEGDENG